MRQFLRPRWQSSHGWPMAHPECAAAAVHKALTGDFAVGRVGVTRVGLRLARRRRNLTPAPARIVSTLLVILQ